MVSVRHGGAEIRQFIVEHVEQHPRDIVTFTAQTFGMSRQGVHRHVQRLVQDNVLLVRGTTRDRQYTLRPRVEWGQAYTLSSMEGEDVVWRRDIRPLLGDLPQHVLDIWQYGVTEMLNNAMEHSGGQTVLVSVTQTALTTKMMIADDGEGIFKKLQRELGLDDERHAVLELAKGKVTTDPARHTGEGIFFTSRVFDTFSILSRDVYFTHMRDAVPAADAEDWIGESPEPSQGTAVFMSHRHRSARTLKEVFDQFTSQDEYSFTTTVVPVRLARYGDEQLISRSQARRLLAGVDRFKVVLLNFQGVEMIGQAFADEVFRVFAAAHPDIKLHAIHMNTPVEQMIRRAVGSKAEGIIGVSDATALW